MAKKKDSQDCLLIFNTGSSSVKFALFLLDHNNTLQSVLRGQIENLDGNPHFYIKKVISSNSNFHLQIQKNTEAEQLINLSANDILHDEYYFLKNNASHVAHKQALDKIFAWLQTHLSYYKLRAVGHRVVHGGDKFLAPVVVDHQILQQLECFIPLAPLHQPYNLAAIKAIFETEPQLPQVACFDTQFHQTQSAIVQAYALPEGISDLPIKRYGFHGLSYEYIAYVLPNYLDDEAAEKRIIAAHLGHGASLCALLNRQSVATTMGFTALEGLPMGTRCGTIDPGILLYLLREEGKSCEELTDLLYFRSGLLGVSEISSDVRTLLKSKHPKAKKALDFFVYRIKRETGSLIAALNGIDSFVFTAGIGENSAEIRATICNLLAEWLEIKLDPLANKNNQSCISTPESKISVWIIPTDEELMIAKHTLRQISP